MTEQRKSPTEAARRNNALAMWQGSMSRKRRQPEATVPSRKPGNPANPAKTNPGSDPAKSKGPPATKNPGGTLAAAAATSQVRRVVQKLATPSYDEHGNRRMIEDRVASVRVRDIESTVSALTGREGVVASRVVPDQAGRYVICSYSDATEPEWNALRDNAPEGMHAVLVRPDDLRRWKATRPVIQSVTKNNPQPFQPLMSWPLPNGNGDCAVARNGKVAVRYHNGEFAPIGSIGREVKENERKRNVLRDVEPVYNAYMNKLQKNERKQ